MKKTVFLLLLAAIGLSLTVIAQQDNPLRGNNIDSLRNFALDSEPAPPIFAKTEDHNVRRTRSYPMQPPTIPHDIRDYQVDINSNKCMFCHSRSKASSMNAPMVSVTHYMDRDGQFLAQVSPGRYFCTQCHVTQQDVKPLVENRFEDVDVLLKRQRDKK